MAYKVIILYRLYMPSYFLGTFTEYPQESGGMYTQRIQNVSVGCFHCCTESTKTLIRRCSYRCLF